MELHWLSQKHEQDLVIFMLGWAATPNAVHHLPLPGFDVLAICNYKTLQPLHAADFASYRRIYLIAWSYGVWVAERCCQALPLYRAIALNGTPLPADDRYGMRLRATLRVMQMAARLGIEPQSSQRAIPPGPYPDRTSAEKLDELKRLAEWSRQDSSAHLKWHTAYIADQDEVFPPANMWAYWQSVGLGRAMAGHHYPFVDPAFVLHELLA